MLYYIIVIILRYMYVVVKDIALIFSISVMLYCILHGNLTQKVPRWDPWQEESTWRAGRSAHWFAPCGRAFWLSWWCPVKKRCLSLVCFHRSPISTSTRWNNLRVCHLFQVSLGANCVFRVRGSGWCCTVICNQTYLWCCCLHYIMVIHLPRL